MQEIIYSWQFGWLVAGFILTIPLNFGEKKLIKIETIAFLGYFGHFIIFVFGLMFIAFFPLVVLVVFTDTEFGISYYDSLQNFFFRKK